MFQTLFQSLLEGLLAFPQVPFSSPWSSTSLCFLLFLGLSKYPVVALLVLIHEPIHRPPTFFYRLLRLEVFCNICTFEINERSTIWRLSQGRSVLTVNFFKSCAVHAPIWAVLGCTCHGLRWFSMYPIFSLISFGIFRHLFPYGPSQVLDIKVGKGQISENNQVIKMLKLPWFFSHTMFYLHDSWNTKATYQFASV